jgi:hypothetical protein
MCDLLDSSPRRRLGRLTSHFELEGICEMTTATVAPMSPDVWDLDPDVRKARDDANRRNTWARCVSLLRPESDEKSEADRSAVLGYN